MPEYEFHLRPQGSRTLQCEQVVALDDDEARSLAEMRLLMTRGVCQVTVHRSGLELHRLERDAVHRQDPTREGQACRSSQWLPGAMTAMFDVASSLPVVADLCPRASSLAPWAFAEFNDIAPDLAELAEVRSAFRGDPLAAPAAAPGLRLVVSGVLGVLHSQSGLCTSLVVEGRPAGPDGAHGVWLTDGAFTDIGFEQLLETYGPSKALAICARASALSQAAVEAELVCVTHHAAPRRLARWLLPVLDASEVAFVTQQELGRWTGLQRTSICAAMAALQRAGAFKVTRGRIVLRDRDVLEAGACRCGSKPSGACRSDPDDEPAPGGRDDNGARRLTG
ncbi:MAG: transcriptional regulator, Crp/Fnr family [Brevundimonas sp.]|nr:transcriptional regulator, Crp/Fnr family [Brevundimonas sp.]